MSQEKRMVNFYIEDDLLSKVMEVIDEDPELKNKTHFMVVCISKELRARGKLPQSASHTDTPPTPETAQTTEVPQPEPTMEAETSGNVQQV